MKGASALKCVFLKIRSLRVNTLKNYISMILNKIDLKKRKITWRTYCVSGIL